MADDRSDTSGNGSSRRSRRGGATPAPTQAEVRGFLDREPPSSVRGEMSLIGSLLLDPARVPEALGAVPSGDMFSSDRHQLVYDALLSVYNAHGTVDLVQLVEHIEARGRIEEVGGPEYLVQMAESVPTAVNAVHYARIVREKYQLRRLIDAAGSILFEAYHASGAEGDEVRRVLDAAEQKIFKVAEDVASVDAEDLRSLLEKQIDFLAANEGRLITGLDTGFLDLNEMTSGLQNGELAIVAGRPSMGKTAFALNLAQQVAAGGTTEPVPVAFFSMEMSRGSVAMRMLSALSGVDSHRLRRNMLNKGDFDRLLRATDSLGRLPIHIDDTPGLTAMMLRAKVRRMVQQHDVKCIFIDYLQLMSAPGASRDGRQQEVSEISRSIKALARDMNVPIVCLAQLNRGAEQREGHRPRMADLRESGSIEQDADVIMLLHREEYYHSQDPAWADNHPEKVGLAEVIIAKQRNGPTGVVELSWDNRTTRFTNRARGSSGGYAAPLTEPKAQQGGPSPADPGDVPV
ncbi:MAG: replicative DNA helicase [Planctomycetota bacterium]